MPFSSVQLTRRLPEGSDRMYSTHSSRPLLAAMCRIDLPYLSHASAASPPPSALRIVRRASTLPPSAAVCAAVMSSSSTERSSCALRCGSSSRASHTSACPPSAAWCRQLRPRSSRSTAGPASSTWSRAMTSPALPSRHQAKSADAPPPWAILFRSDSGRGVGSLDSTRRIGGIRSTRGPRRLCVGGLPAPSTHMPPTQAKGAGASCSSSKDPRSPGGGHLGGPASKGRVFKLEAGRHARSGREPSAGPLRAQTSASKAAVWNHCADVWARF
mmetsp:Transcript_10860/g.26585  ORF Transcript_10860/g.26585 Transcript_10860/m.26585 type:complete len:272 (-) Transcript_10860:123-938(-)